MRRLVSVVYLLCMALLVVARPTQNVSARAEICKKSAMPSGTIEQVITVDGLKRPYRLHIPSGYDGTKFVPLVLSLHGFAGYAAQQENYSGWSTLADKEGFIAVYPNGTGMPLRWYAGNSGYLGNRQLVDDVAFFRALFDALDKSLCVDDMRIFVNGLSNGGGMTNRLACELADRIAAVGTVAGAYSPLEDGCNPAHPIPLVAFHGTADPLVNYDGALDQRFPPIKEWFAAWAKRNGCTKGPDSFFSNGDVSGSAYSDCQMNADVQLYTIAGGGHTWPGSSIALPLGKTTQDINATETMWKFFQAHAMPARP